MERFWKILGVVGVGLLVTTLIGVGRVLEKMDTLERVTGEIKMHGFVGRDEYRETLNEIDTLHDIHVRAGDID